MGLNIYCAMDVKAQEAAEKKIREWKTPKDEYIDIGYEMMDFEGRVLATVGSRFEKDGRLLWDNVTQSVLQPGSTIKPISSYVIALDRGMINFSSLIADKPVSDWGLNSDGEVISGPNNWYGKYYGSITVTRALNLSSNAAAVSVVNEVGLDESYRFLTEQLNLKHLDPEHDAENLSGLSIGGFYGGTTVEEMTASYQIFVNGGYYFEPYSYFMVTDNDGNTLLDNTDRGKPDQIISTESATIMNRLLHEVVNAGGEGEALGYRTAIDGWDIIGKTGTTDSACDNWFVGASPYALAGVWAGHDSSRPIAEEEVNKVHYLWRDIMAEWLKGKANKNYDLGGNVVQHNYVMDDGGLTDLTIDGVTAVGYYTEDNMPGSSSYFTRRYESSSSSESSSYSNYDSGDDDDDEDEDEESSEDDTDYDDTEESSEDEYTEDDTGEDTGDDTGEDTGDDTGDYTGDDTGDSGDTGDTGTEDPGILEPGTLTEGGEDTGGE